MTYPLAEIFYNAPYGVGQGILTRSKAAGESVLLESIKDLQSFESVKNASNEIIDSIAESNRSWEDFERTDNTREIVYENDRMVAKRIAYLSGLTPSDYADFEEVRDYAAISKVNAEKIYDVWLTTKEKSGLLRDDFGGDYRVVARLANLDPDDYLDWGAMAADEAATTAIAASETATNTVAASPTAMTAAAASETLMTAIAASETAMNTAVASEAVMNVVAASETAMTAMFASWTAKGILFESPEAQTAFRNSATATTYLDSIGVDVGARGEGWSWSNLTTKKVWVVSASTGYDGTSGSRSARYFKHLIDGVSSETVTVSNNPYPGNPWSLLANRMFSGLSIVARSDTSSAYSRSARVVYMEE